jgi:hypothetical protein
LFAELHAFFVAGAFVAAVNLPKSVQTHFLGSNNPFPALNAETNLLTRFDNRQRTRRQFSCCAVPFFFFACSQSGKASVRKKAQKRFRVLDHAKNNPLAAEGVAEDYHSPIPVENLFTSDEALGVLVVPGAVKQHFRTTDTDVRKRKLAHTKGYGFLRELFADCLVGNHFVVRQHDFFCRYFLHYSTPFK